MVRAMARQLSSCPIGETEQPGVQETPHPATYQPGCRIFMGMCQFLNGPIGNMVVLSISKVREVFLTMDLTLEVLLLVLAHKFIMRSTVFLPPFNRQP